MEIKLDEGYQFGLGVFETIAVENGRPVLLAAHLKRLQQSMDFFEIRQQVTKEQVFAYLDDRRLRRGALKIIASADNLVWSMRDNPYQEEQYRQGFVLDYSQIRRNETSPLTFYKTLNYGDCILEKRRAAAAGCDERIFLNTRGEICEGCTTNIFFVRDGCLYTPPSGSGLLPGVIRAWIIGQEAVTEQTLRPDDVSGFQECFVTNSLLGIMPVRELDGHLFTGSEAGQRLRERYQKQFNIN